MDPSRIIEALSLEPHPEGGFYREIHRSAETVPWAALPERFSGDRAFCTSIYYLLTAESFSAMHRVRSDEIYYFHVGDPVLLLRLRPDGGGDQVTLGVDLDRGHRPQAVVPAGTWQGARMERGGSFALLGCSVAPGFDFADFEIADRDDLIGRYPRWVGLIRELTR